jgi:GNAT superfamily N-acetyltransferase
MTIEYRVFDETLDHESQRQLFRLSFPETAGTSVEGDAHQHWKFGAYPATPPSYQYVASETGGLVGYYAAIPYAYSVDGVRTTCAMVCDVMTHPDRRGKGIFTRIGHYATAELAHEGLGFASGYPVRPEVIPGHLKVGWKQVEQLPVYLRVLGLRSLLPSSLRFLAPALDPLAWLAQAWVRDRRAGYEAEVLERREFLERHADGAPGEYAAFLAAWMPRSGNALYKTMDFLRWRTGAPDTRYLFVTLRHRGVLVGVAITRPVAMKGVETLAVLDLMVLPGHARGSRVLHGALRRLARREEKDAVACMCSRASAKAHGFAASGYLRTPYAFTLIIKKLDAAIPEENLYSGERWQVFWLDSDDL